MKERDLIERISSMATGNSSSLLFGIGDDCAVIKSVNDQVLLYTMDTLIESVHFNTAWHPPELLGRKAVTVNVSDIAAMGGRPRHILFSLGLPSAFDEVWAGELCKGVVQACKQYGCVLVGGDTVLSPGGVSLTLTVVGEAETEQVLYRHGAKAGDVILVSGSLGLAAGGLALCEQGQVDINEYQQLVTAHLNPAARVELGRILAKSGMVHAMMDLSDGLATDLAHLCTCSGLGARIIQEQLPVTRILEQAAQALKKESVNWMIAGGEDYELLLTVPPSAVKELQEVVAGSGYILYPVGEMVDENGVQLISKKGRETKIIEYLGFDHFCTT